MTLKLRHNAAVAGVAPANTGLRAATGALATASALAVALVLGTASPAAAQDSDTASLGEDSAGSVMGSLGMLPVGSTANAIGSIGSADFPLVGGSTEPLRKEPRPRKEVTEVSVLEKKQAGAYEIWVVDSVVMQREIALEVLPSTSSEAAPVLHLLDGVDAQDSDSGFRSITRPHERPIGSDNVHIVVPTGGPAAYWTDWDAADPVLGYNKWETFLTEELPGIVATQLNVTDKAAVGGISMGGQAAMHLAANYDMYDAVMSFSGNYSTMNALGYQTMRLTIETRGGDVDNMWGPHGGPQWKANDTISHVEGLRGKKVYFSAANGVMGEGDAEVYNGDVRAMAAGLVLERGVLEGTKAFDKALKKDGIDHRVDYLDSGLHHWGTFMRNFDEAWDYIKPALQN